MIPHVLKIGIAAALLGSLLILAGAIVLRNPRRISPKAFIRILRRRSV